jgi:tetratricopeptide (TPR) repeat protein
MSRHRAPPASGSRGPRRAGLLAVGLIVAAGLAAYADSFRGVFVFDDISEIERNPAIRQLWPPDTAMLDGPGLPRRPIPYYTFALNYALDGNRVWGYHLVNLAVHLACAGLLFGIVRRTLAEGRLAPRYGRAATGIALAAAILWTVHPLQTQAVTYVYQRLESLSAMFYLLTLYCFLRGVPRALPALLPEPAGRRLPAGTQRQPQPDAGKAGGARAAPAGSRFWLWGSLAACALGMASKETMVTAPLLLLWYDRVFVAGSWAEIAHKRGKYHAMLAATWLVLAAVVWSQAYRYAEFAASPHTPISYALNQAPVVLHYLRLAFWPQGQCLYYLWPAADSFVQLLPPLAAVLALGGACLVCVFRRPPLGFLLGSFWLILAPTSSIFPVYELAFEHRVYLPLAALAVTAVLAGYEASGLIAGRGRRPTAVAAARMAAVAALTIALAVTTYARNTVYHSFIGMLLDVAAKAPHNWEAYGKLAQRYLDLRDYAESAKYGRLALDWCPPPQDARDAKALAPVHCNLGIALLRLGDQREAVQHLQSSLELDPSLPTAEVNLGNALLPTSPEAALACYQRALRLDPKCAEAYNNLGWILARRDPDVAMPYFEQALVLEPTLASAQENLDRCLQWRRSRGPR